MSGRSLVHGRRPATERWCANGWHEPYESRGSRTDLWGTGGEIPPVYPAGRKSVPRTNDSDAVVRRQYRARFLLFMMNSYRSPSRKNLGGSTRDVSRKSALRQGCILYTVVRCCRNWHIPAAGVECNSLATAHSRCTGAESETTCLACLRRYKA